MLEVAAGIGTPQGRISRSAEIKRSAIKPYIYISYRLPDSAVASLMHDTSSLPRSDPQPQHADFIRKAPFPVGAGLFLYAGWDAIAKV